MKRRKVIRIAVAILAIGCMICMGGCGEEKVTVTSNTGTYTGHMNDGVQEFLGIRYAAPVERWKAPEDVTTTSEDEIDATEWGPCCIQPYDDVEIASQGELDEDCLNLNIWTKDAETKGKPVMVFIHGGGFMNGGSNDPMYKGDKFVRNLAEGEDMVFVSINYRTNLFGSIDLSQLEGYTDEYYDAVNVWILDQIQALKWVNENIEAFGGDVNNITVSGQSCGGMSISYMLAMEEATQYFQKAIIESGAPHISQYSKETKEEVAAMAFDELGVKTLDELLALEDDEIKDNGLDEYFENLQGLSGIYPDGKIIPTDWWDRIREGSAKDIKVMIGCTNGENDWAAFDFENMPETVKDPQIIWDEYILPAVEDTKYFINPAKADGTPSFDLDAFLATDEDKVKAMVDLENAMSYVQGTEYEAEALSQYNDTYAYYWTYAPDGDSIVEYCLKNDKEPEISPYGRAMHSMGLVFAFGTTEGGYEELTGDPAKLPPELSEMMQSAYYHFIKTGDPNSADIPEWKTYDAADRNTMVMGETWELVKDPRQAQRIAFSCRPQGEK